MVIARWRDLKADILLKLADASGGTRFWLSGGGYDRNIDTYEELNEKMNYIHGNPVERLLAPRSVDWAWSSARWYEGLDAGGLAMDPIE